MFCPAATLRRRNLQEAVKAGLTAQPERPTSRRKRALRKQYDERPHQDGPEFGWRRNHGRPDAIADATWDGEEARTDSGLEEWWDVDAIGMHTPGSSGELDDERLGQGWAETEE